MILPYIFTLVLMTNLFSDLPFELLTFVVLIIWDRLSPAFKTGNSISFPGSKLGAGLIGAASFGGVFEFVLVQAGKKAKLKNKLSSDYFL